MLSNPEAEQPYALHTAHKSSDWRKRIYVGLAEDVEEVLQLALSATEVKHYSIISSCVDGSPTLRLNQRHQTQRIGLRLFSVEQVHQLMDQLEAGGISRVDRLNALDRETLKEKRVQRIIRVMRPWFDSWRKWRYADSYKQALSGSEQASASARSAPAGKPDKPEQ